MKAAIHANARRRRLGGWAGLTLIASCRGCRPLAEPAGEHEVSWAVLELVRELAQSWDQEPLPLQRFGNAHDVEREHAKLRQRHE